MVKKIIEDRREKTDRDLKRKRHINEEGRVGK